MAPAGNATLGGYVFHLVPPDLQGRVGAAFALLVGLPVACVSLIAGTILQTAGLRLGIATAIALAVACVLLSALVPSRPRYPHPRPLVRVSPAPQAVQTASA